MEHPQLKLSFFMLVSTNALRKKLSRTARILRRMQVVVNPVVLSCLWHHDAML
jgi:hypothetical protein